MIRKENQGDTYPDRALGRGGRISADLASGPLDHQFVAGPVYDFGHNYKSADKHKK